MESSAPPEPRGAGGRPGGVASRHWLVRVAQRAGLGSGTPEVLASQPISEAWPMVARAFGVTDDELGGAVAKYYRLEVADLKKADKLSARLLTEAFARKHLVIPVGESDRYIFVATADPTDVEAEREIGFTSGRTAVFQIAPPAEIEHLINQWFSTQHVVEEFLDKIHIDDVDEDAVELVEQMEHEAITELETETAPVVKLTNLVIQGAITQGASDIHIEPSRGSLGAVRYRVDGVLHKAIDLPVPAMHRIISRIKILADLDIADRLRPQDGKARVRVQNHAYDLRISTIPATGGVEKCVIRILDSAASPSLDGLGLPEYELARLRQLLGFREGVVIVTGPTGSGKTTTLYGALREISDGKINIMTVEDPVEYELPSVTQTQVAVKQGVTFASALRAMLRQDPDVILVGEIRDEETAQVAFRAAMTGHLVLATVHANDAVGAVARLTDLGLDNSTIASSLRGTLAQRLLRRVCSSCGAPVEGELSSEERQLAQRHGIEPTVRAVGCPACGFTGFKGRVPVQEVLVVDPAFQAAVETHKGTGILVSLAHQGGMRTMHEVAREWVGQGLTTLSEVERVLGQLVDVGREEKKPERARILVVDDDGEARVMMRTLLEKHDYDVVAAEDGEEALETLKQDANFSLVILDLGLPGMDGFEVLEEMRHRPRTGALPVLVRTGTGSHELETKLLEAGADDYITKSVEASRFMARVKAVLRRAGF